MVKRPIFLLILISSLQFSCTQSSCGKQPADKMPEGGLVVVDTIGNQLPEEPVTESIPPLRREDIRIQKELQYDKYTLEDVYAYKTTSRKFQWEKIRDRLFFLDSIQSERSSWAVLSNYRNRNKEAPLVKKYYRNEYKLIADTFGVARYQSVPLYQVNDSVTPERYGRDGSLVKYLGKEGTFARVSTVSFEGEWLIPPRYIKTLPEEALFRYAIFVDVTNQNITMLEKVDSIWYIRSMNPATTGLHKPPYQHETPLGLFLIQEKKKKMIFLKDGSTETGGFAPFASRFCNGGYIHGVPVNAPRTTHIEYSASLGTTPRSHMCVRNVTSHAEFVFNRATINESVVFVID